MQSTVREQQARILEAWARRKRQLDRLERGIRRERGEERDYRCQQYVLLESSREQLSGWLKGEGKERMVKIKEAENDQKRREELGSLILALTQQRSLIHTMLATGEHMANESGQHREDVRRCIR